MKRRLTQLFGGSLVFAMFGCAAAAYGVYVISLTDGKPWLPGLPMVVGLILIVALMKLQRRIEALPDERPTLAMQDRDALRRKLFATVNLAVFVGLVVTFRYCTSAQRTEWIAPIAAVLMGLHFLALAIPMELRTYFVVGGLLCLFPPAVLALLPAGYWSVTIGLGGGAILWAAYAVHVREVLTALPRHRDTAR